MDKDNIVRFRLDSNTKEKLRELASNTHMGYSTWLREMIVEHFQQLQETRENNDDENS